METRNTLFLLDAYALIYRAYYAFIKNPRINSKGLNTSPVYGFVNTLEEIIRKENPAYIGIAFDPSGPTFRHELYPEYKAQREKTPEDIRRAVPVIKDIIRAYNIPILEVSGYEADDVIGTLSRQASDSRLRTYMVTPDKDYGQLVKENVMMYRPKHSGGFEVMGTEEVKQKYGVDNTLQIIDLLGLMGDSSDNIPGCPGVGEKTAQKLIKDFGSIDALLERTDELRGALKKKVSDNAEQIRFSKFLATIKTDVPITLNLEELKNNGPDLGLLRTIFQDLEFRTMFEKVKSRLGHEVSAKPAAEPDLFSAAADTAPKSRIEKKSAVPVQGDLFAINPTNCQGDGFFSKEIELSGASTACHRADNESDIAHFCSVMSTAQSVSIRLDATGIEPMTAVLNGIALCIDAKEAYYIPLPSADKDETARRLKLLEPVLAKTDSLKVGHNIKYDIIVLHNHGIDIRGRIFDTMLAHYLLQPELNHSLSYMAEICLGGRTTEDEEPYKSACLKAAAICELKSLLEKAISTKHLERLLYDMELPLVPVLVRMETNGVLIDTAALRQTSADYTAKLTGIEQDIYADAGTTFNISSPKQVGEVLFDRLRLSDKPKKTRGGQYVTSEDVLESLKSKHQIIGRILEYRGLKKLLGTYIDALPLLINPETGRIHTSFNQAVTATGRLSSSNPNLQNIPVRDDEGREIRKAFIPDEGCLFFSADYSQIELRIMAHLSGDENMIEAFLEGHDIHAATAAKIYKVGIGDVTKEMRRKAKTANFGIIYGISVFGLAERLEISRTEAKELIDGYFRTYPQIKAYMDSSIESARRNGYVETIFGRKRYLPDINSGNSIVRGYAERNAINAPIQGSAADIIKMAMINVFRQMESNNLKAKMILQVHDELNFSVPPEEKDIIQEIVIREMENAYTMKVPLKADYGWGNNWLEAH